MAKIIVINHLTLDAVMQAPGRPDEDTRGGFEHGGWAVPNTTRSWAGSTGIRGRMFPEGGGPAAALQLVDSVTTTKGVLIATYRATEPAGSGTGA